MSKISALDFVNNVERNRKSLRQHCLENGKQVLENETLDNIVAMNNEIKTGTLEGQFKVEFKDLDGTYVAPTQYVNYGESATIPEQIPNFDEEYLEFDYWATSGGDDLNNVQRDILCMPQYKTKYDETTQQRPTYLICYFGDDSLNPTIQIGSTHTNTFIDWGDSSAIEQVTSSTISHTYDSSGQYVIKLYGDSYGVGGNSSYGLFDSSSYQYSLIKAYLGENLIYRASCFRSCRALTNAILSNGDILSYFFYGCTSLINIVIPNSTTLDSYSFWECQSLKNVIMSSNIKNISSYVFYNCYSLNRLVFPDNTSIVSAYCFLNCYSLTSVILSNKITTIPESLFSYCYSLAHTNISNNVKSLDYYSFRACYSLTEVTIPSSVVSINIEAFNSCYSLKNIILYENFDLSLSCASCPLTDECLIDIANKLKDNSGLSTKTLTLSSRMCKTRMNTIYINEFGERVEYGTIGAISLLAYIQNKNWTVSFST